jgi:hypothetical protein
MKRTIVIATLATLAACSQAERDRTEGNEAAAATAEVEAAPAAEVMAADGKSPVGTFEITASDG